VKVKWHVTVLEFGVSGVILFVLMLEGCSTSENELAESEWGELKNSIQAMLYSPRSNLKMGEQIDLRVKFRNVANDVRIVPSSYMTINMSRNGKGFADAIGSGDLYDNIKLSPGQILDFHLACCRTDHQGAGIYEFSGAAGGLQLRSLKIYVK